LNLLNKETHMAASPSNHTQSQSFLDQVLSNPQQRQQLHRYLQRYIFITRPCNAAPDEAVIQATATGELRSSA
jgi:hypothetical protein